MTLFYFLILIGFIVFTTVVWKMFIDNSHPNHPN